VQAFSQKGVQAYAWDGLQRKMDAFGWPNSGEREIILNEFPKYIKLIYLKRNSFNFEYYYEFIR
jgi:hypothetical protein